MTGKTTRLMNEYVSLTRNGVWTDRILVLVMNGTQLRKWRKALKLPVSGSLQIFTYWGFLQREINRYWHWILPHLGEGDSVIKPLFLNAESAHYLMTLLVEEQRARGGFARIVATSSKIALQVLNNLNQTAINGISIEEGVCRLKETCRGDNNKLQAFDDVLYVATAFREHCLRYRCLDYSLLVELYNKYLLPNEVYQTSLKQRYTHLIVDNLEEAIPAEINLIKLLLGSVETAYLAFDPSGGHTSSFGAAPELARDEIYPLCRIEKLEHLYGCTQDAARLTEVLYRNVSELEKKQISSNVINPKGIRTGFRADMISRVGRAIIDLLRSGVPPSSIAVVAPAVDKVMEVSLSQQLGAAGYSVQNIARRKYLSEETYAQVMVSLASLIEPEAGWMCNRASLARCFHIVLGLDPVRSSLLADSCFKGGSLRLPDLDEEGLRARIGFDKGKEYDNFKEKLEKIAEDRHTPDRLFQRIFSEILAPVIEEHEDIVTSRQIIDSAIKFYKTYHALPLLQEQPFVQRFVDLITKGTVAAEAFYQEDIRDDAVILATPLALFRNSLSVQYQFWVDCSDTRWFTKDYKELSNPIIMSRTWDKEWNDAKALELRRQSLARTLAGLLYRCRGTVTVVESEYDSLGYVRESNLPEIIFNSVVSSR